MKKQNGFTLIELIVTIALLAVVAAISFVSISKVLESSKDRNCESIISSIKTAANEYASDKRLIKDFIDSVNENKEVSIYANTLIGENYLSSPIINPYTKDEVTAADIKIEYKLNANYTVNKITITYNDSEDFCEELKKN